MVTTIAEGIRGVQSILSFKEIILVDLTNLTFARRKLAKSRTFHYFASPALSRYTFSVIIPKLSKRSQNGFNKENMYITKNCEHFYCVIFKKPILII